jgi:hypothetical protein
MLAVLGLQEREQSMGVIVNEMNMLISTEKPTTQPKHDGTGPPARP